MLTLLLLWESNFKRIANFKKCQSDFKCDVKLNDTFIKIWMNHARRVMLINFRCRDAKGHLKEIYTHFTCATDTTNIQVRGWPLTTIMWHVSDASAPGASAHVTSARLSAVVVSTQLWSHEHKSFLFVFLTFVVESNTSLIWKELIDTLPPPSILTWFFSVCFRCSYRCDH